MGQDITPMITGFDPRRPQPTPTPEPTPLVTAEDARELLKRQMLLNAFKTRELAKPTPEQAKLSEYYIEQDPFVIEDGRVKSGQLPGNIKFRNFGPINKNVILSKINPQEARVLDAMGKAAELSMIFDMDHFSSQDNAQIDQMEIINYAGIRRGIDGFGMKSINATTHEQVSTLHTESQVQNMKQKGRLQSLLGGGQ